MVERLHQTREDIGSTNARAGTNATVDRVSNKLLEHEIAWAILSLRPAGGETKLNGYGHRTKRFGGNMAEQKG